MNLFNVLKYPISDRPTEAELAALPEQLLYDWKVATKWVTSVRGEFSVINNQPILSWLSGDSFYGSFPGHREERMQQVDLLRKMIAEYESV
jgi:hypothetical protein